MDIEEVLSGELVRKSDEKNIFSQINEKDLKEILELYYSNEKNGKKMSL